MPGLFRPRHHVAPRPDLPQRVGPDATAVVVGGGIAGVSAALVLAERGVQVELLEAAPHLGGRLGTWDRTLADGSEVVVEHGYHGFFRQYYTLRDLLRRIDPDLGFLRDVGGYPIASRPSVGWEPEDFTALPRTPLLNLVALVLRSPSFKLSELRHVNADEALAMLHYDPVRTYAEHDHRSAAELLDSLGFSDRGRAMLFEVFAHSFFNVEERYSAAEFLAMCHFYFTGNPEGLGMDAPTEDYRTALWEPFTRLLEKHGATVTTGARAVALRPDGARGWAVDVEREPARHARHLVVATDVPATRDLVAASPELVATAPGLARGIASLPGGEPYVVARLFCEGDVDPGRAVFTGVTRERVLDSVTLFHRLEGGSARWAAAGPGPRSVVELHSYACPAGTSRDELVAAMREELAALWPEAADLRVVDVDAHRYTNAPGFDPGYHLVRPGVLTDARGLRLAGDWVACDVPSALMERAAVTAVTAANDVLREEGAAPEPMRSIPPRGILARRPRA
ncbi:FAD-dependent oxidoreductase [Actinomycetospora chlora]|uniref:FAD-dependent oxidoreductase n=1 Tax=Actinomycetospora chlora TaxID=663608 RepID=A0ABP9CTS2_9PSEU